MQAHTCTLLAEAYTACGKHDDASRAQRKVQEKVGDVRGAADTALEKAVVRLQAAGAAVQACKLAVQERYAQVGDVDCILYFLCCACLGNANSGRLGNVGPLVHGSMVHFVFGF